MLKKTHLVDSPSKHFCSSPFVSTRQTAWDKISPCAFGPIEVQVDSDTSQKDRWNHPALNSLRDKFIKGKRPRECKRCWDEEDAGIYSLRLRTNDQYGTHNIGWEKGPRELVIKTTNVCNLACRTCGGWDTSLYWPEGKHYKEVYGAKNNDFIQTRNKAYHNSNSYQLEDLVNVEKISFFGGEPLLDKTHAVLLKKLIEADRAKHTTLFYSTNGQQIAKHYEKLWSQFKRIELFFSIDGIEEQFTYLRWPGDWNKTVKNIDWFLDLPNRYPKVDWFYQGSQCVSLINIADYQKTANWLRNKFKSVHFNIVDHPNHYRMTNLPDFLKSKIVDTIEDEDIRNYLTIETANLEDLERMIVWTKRQDIFRNQNYSKAFPNTYKLLEPYWGMVNNLHE
tara:strand:+ start:2681 stop:3859 length:1179 start_codon:yes stop_codon:yes gene_type:complete